MSKQSRKVVAVLFDLDDTLNDRNASWAAFVAVLCRKYKDQITAPDEGVVLQAILTADRGGYRVKDELFVELSQQSFWINAPEPKELEAFWRQIFADCMVEREGAKSLLADIRTAGLRTGIVTNGRTDMQAKKLRQLDLNDLVDVVVISESAGVKKPHPKIFLDAMQALSCASESVLFVGDNPELDVVGPASIGMQTAWLMLGREWPAKHQAPDHQISMLDELRHILNLGTGKNGDSRSAP